MTTMTNKEIELLKKALADFYMGELVPPPEAIRGYYDSEAWESYDPCTYYRDCRPCIECMVEYIHSTDKYMYLGEHILAAHITLYHGNGETSKKIEYWNAEHVRKFTVWVNVA